ncbi:MAG: DNA starvation/stationary phase protection protein Dps [Gemmatimonadaceae bacterium]
MATAQRPKVGRGTENGAKLHRTKNGLPEGTRTKAAALLQQRLADCIDLQSQCKQAHWNVKGENFIALHKLFDDVNEAVGEYVDLLAERAVQLGAQVEGTARAVARRSKLTEYPLDAVRGEEHVEALSGALAQFGDLIRETIDTLDEAEDKDSADVATEISRGIDKWAWFVEAHNITA